MSTDLVGRATAIIAAMAPVPAAEVAPETRLVADLGYDSVRLIELSIALEQDLGHAPVDEEALYRVHTVGDVVTLVTGGTP